VHGLTKGFLEQLLINLTMKVRTATCAGARAAKVAAPTSGAGRMRIASGACSRRATGLSGK